MFKPQPLQFKLEELEPFLSAKTVDFHYNKHTKGYFDKVNKLVKDTIYEDEDDLAKLVKRATPGSKLYNNAAQAWNHDFFWNCLTPESDSRSKHGDVFEQINKQYGSEREFFEEFNKKAENIFGSGWCWLIYVGDELDILPRTGAEGPLTVVGTTAVTPLLVVDVWEHAYYIDYQDDRKEYLSKFWNNVNWDFVNEQYQRAAKEKGRSTKE